MTGPTNEDHTYDDNYADYKAMTARHDMDHMTPEQWQKAVDSDD